MPHIRFFLDEHISKAIAKGLRQRGVDVLTCAEAGRLTASDLEHLHFSKANGFVIVTADNDFLAHHSNGVQHSGIAFLPKPMPVGVVINALLLIYEVFEPAEMDGHVEFL